MLEPDSNIRVLSGHIFLTFTDNMEVKKETRKIRDRQNSKASFRETSYQNSRSSFRSRNNQLYDSVVKDYVQRKFLFRIRNIWKGESEESFGSS